jgi:virginiamycin A acetyltransferase
MFYKLFSYFKNVIRPSRKVVSTNELIGLIQLAPTTKIVKSTLKGNVVVGERSFIYSAVLDGKVIVGSNTTINGPGTEMYSINNSIAIGNFCSIARGTAVQEHNHNTAKPTTYFIRFRVFNDKYGSDVVSSGGVTIGNDVWIGTQCTILSGVTIGDGAVIAANSVVTSDVPPYAIVGGTPAKVLKYRFSPEIIEKLLEICWWNWSYDKILRNKEFFYDDLILESFNKIRD